MIVVIDTPDGPTHALVVTPRLQVALDRIRGTKSCPDYLATAWDDARQEATEPR